MTNQLELARVHFKVGQRPNSDEGGFKTVLLPFISYLLSYPPSFKDSGKLNFELFYDKVESL